MVAQVLPDAGEVRDDVYAKLPQMVFRTDAGQHQKLRRVDCSAAQNHLVSVDAEDLAPALRLDADTGYVGQSMVRSLPEFRL